MDKVCAIHGLTPFRDATKDRSNGRCLKCAVVAVKKRRKKVKEMAVEYKGGLCIHCRVVYPPSVFEFHHVDPSLKDFSMGEGGRFRSWEKIKAELDKCIMLCANCHRLEHLRLDGLCC